MSQDNLLQQRHSMRQFKDQQVDVATLKAILADAQQAPSWENSQPWHLYLATGATAKQIRGDHEAAIAAKAPSTTEFPGPKSWAAFPQKNIDDWQKQAQPYLSALGQGNETLFNAPAILYITLPKDATIYSGNDAGAFAYGVMLAAAQRGLGTVAAYAFVRYPEEIHKQFDIPANEAIFIGIGIGYATDDQLNDFVPKRLPLDSITQIKN